MLIINKSKLETHALNDPKDKMYDFAHEYDKGIKQLREQYGDKIRFVRPGFPKRTKGIDPRNKEVPNMALPTPPMIIPLTAEVNGRTGLEIWQCALENPTLLANGQWELGNRRSIMVKDGSLTVNLKKEPELAFFIYFKSPFYSKREGKKGLLVIDDPVASAKAEGDKARAELQLQTALYGVLADEEQLKLIAQSYGVAQTDKKHADAIRTELKALVLAGESNKKRNPLAKGIREFLEELKVTDAVRLRSLVMTAIDKGKIKYFSDGVYKIGERPICKVTLNDLSRKLEFLCNHLSNVANRPKLQDVLRDIVDKEVLDKSNDPKTFLWLSRMMDLGVELKEPDVIRDRVYACFVEGVVAVEEVKVSDPVKEVAKTLSAEELARLTAEIKEQLKAELEAEFEAEIASNISDENDVAEPVTPVVKKPVVKRKPRTAKKK
jgi:hypothetical protein